jgi:hypothetical protein
MSRKVSLILSFLFALLTIFFAVYVNVSISKPIKENRDIYYSYFEGQRLQRGENPYARILEGNMFVNQKYPTYFPVFYELSYISEELGLNSFVDWIGFWRVVFMIFEFAVAALLYIVLARRNLEWMGVFACGFWLLNRWTLNLVQEANMDFIPIFFLLLSLELFPQKKWLSLFLFSLSLGFKQIAIFAVPLYLIWIFHLAGRDWIKQTIKGVAIIMSVPFISALPFLIWNAKGFVESILFSVTRLAGGYYFIPSVDVLLNWDGYRGRIVMLILMALIYLFAVQGYGKKYFMVFATLMVFLYFNAILFAQYETWVVPFIPLLLVDIYGPRISMNEKLPAPEDFRSPEISQSNSLS